MHDCWMVFSAATVGVADTITSVTYYSVRMLNKLHTLQTEVFQCLKS